MSVVLVTPPSREVVTLAQAKEWLHVDTDDENDTISLAIEAAVEDTERILSQRLLTQTWDWFLDDFPDLHRFPLAPVQSIESVKYYAEGAGSLTTLSSSYYEIDTKAKPHRFALQDGESWPSVDRRQNAVVIRFVAGFGPELKDVPATIRLALRYLIDHWFNNRGPLNTQPGVTYREIPRTVNSLLNPHRLSSGFA